MRYAFGAQLRQADRRRQDTQAAEMVYGQSGLGSVDVDSRDDPGTVTERLLSDVRPALAALAPSGRPGLRGAHNGRAGPLAPSLAGARVHRGQTGARRRTAVLSLAGRMGAGGGAREVLGRRLLGPGRRPIP